jgi:RyR domain
MNPFIIPKVTVLAWEAEGVIDRPHYEGLAAMAHDLSIAIGEMLGVMGPDSWIELPEEVRTPLTVFAQRIIEERLSMSEFHDLWCESLLIQGYSFGKENDEEAKTNSLLVPYANLPAPTRIMDACFESAVLWMFRERHPVLFDLMPAQNDPWVEYQQGKGIISLAHKGN